MSINSDYNAIRSYLLAKPEAVEDFPFGPDAAVFKVKNKLFAILMHREGQVQVNLKCDPAEALALRDIFASVKPGYHMNKAHWNTVILDGSIPENELIRMIDNSFLLVVKGMPKKNRRSIELKL